MNSITAILFTTSAAVIVLPAVAGLILFRVGDRRRAASIKALGTVFGAASIVASGVLFWFGVVSLSGGMQNWRVLLMLISAIAAVAATTLAGIPLALLYLYFRRDQLRAAGYTALPGFAMAAVSATILACGSAWLFVEHIGPRLQMWPYSSLSAGGGPGRTVLHGWSDWSERSDPIIWVDFGLARAETVQFDLGSLDALGNITVRIARTEAPWTEPRLVKLPFEPSLYAMNDHGRLLRVVDGPSQASHLVGRWSEVRFTDRAGSDPNPNVVIEMELRADGRFVCSADRSPSTQRTGRYQLQEFLIRLVFDEAASNNAGWCGLRALRFHGRGEIRARVVVIDSELALTDDSGSVQLQMKRRKP